MENRKNENEYVYYCIKTDIRTLDEDTQINETVIYKDGIYSVINMKVGFDLEGNKQLEI